MNRNRAIILVAFIVIILGVVAAFVIPSLNDDSGSTDTVGETTTEQTTTENNATPLPTPEPVVVAEIFVAVQNIARGAVIVPGAVDAREWPIEPINTVPENAIRVLRDENGNITNVDEIVGFRARVDIFVEQPVLTSFVIPDLSQIASAGSDLSASIPQGLRAVAMPMDRITSVAYGIQQGDRVDLIVSLLFVEVDEEFQSILPNILTVVVENPETGALEVVSGIEGRPTQFSAFGSVFDAIEGPREEARPQLVTQMTIQNALVMGVGDFPADGILYGESATATPAVIDDTQPAAQQQQAEAIPTPQPPRPDIVTLAVSPQDAVILTYLIEARIPITFALRSANDLTQPPTIPISLDTVMQEFDITLPDRLPYSIQPAIRSIRQLIVGDEITLDN